MGIGFLAMLAGILNINQELYEAAYIDGMKSKLQEILYYHPIDETSNVIWCCHEFSCDL